MCVSPSPGLTPDLPEVADTHRAADPSVEVPADLEVGMVGVWPAEIKKKTGSRFLAGVGGGKPGAVSGGAWSVFPL